MRDITSYHDAYGNGHGSMLFDASATMGTVMDCQRVVLYLYCDGRIPLCR